MSGIKWTTIVQTIARRTGKITQNISTLPVVERTAPLKDVMYGGIRRRRVSIREQNDKESNGAEWQFSDCLHYDFEDGLTVPLHHHSLHEWHEGELEVSWMEYPDHSHDEDIETDENKERNPQWFIWSCCEKDGEVEPCESGRHEEPTERYRRAKH